MDAMEAFEAHRPHLHAVATRILGSRAEADDALQEAWIRVDRAGTAGVDNIGGGATTGVSRRGLASAAAGRPPRVPDDARRAQAPPRGGTRGRPPAGPDRHARRRRRAGPGGRGAG